MSKDFQVNPRERHARRGNGKQHKGFKRLWFELGGGLRAGWLREAVGQRLRKTHEAASLKLL